MATATRQPDRLSALRATLLSDRAPDESFDRLTRLASRFLAVPISLLSLLGEDRQFVKSAVGLPLPWASAGQTPLAHPFGRHAVEARGPLVVDDARQQPALGDDPAVGDLGVVAYLGVPLFTADGHALGSFCAIDSKPRAWSEADVATMRDLAASVVAEVELRYEAGERRAAERRMRIEHAVINVLATAAGQPADAMAKVIRTVAEATGFQWAAMWVVDGGENVIRCERTWHAPDFAAGGFEHLTTRTAFTAGQGLPGRVWASGKPDWVIDTATDANFPRGPVARDAGLRSGFGFPITIGDEVSGVMEFFGREPRGPDLALLALMAGVGAQVGQFVERWRSEGALRQNEERLAAMVRSALDCIVGMDHEGRVTEWNPAAERAFGYTRDEALGREMAGLIIPPDYRDAHREGLAHYLATGTGPVLGRRLELTAVRKGGEEFPVELTITVVHREGPPAFTGQIRDVTAQRRAQEELERNRQLFQRIAETTPDVLFLFDVPGRRSVYSNREIATLLGYAPEEVVAMGEAVLATVVHPDDMDRVGQFIRRFDTLGDGEVFEYDYRVVHKDGTVRWVTTRAVVFSRSPDGGPHLVMGLSQDVTQRRRQQEAVRESEERLRVGLAAGNTGLWDWDVVRNTVAWSERVYEFHGVTPQTFGGTVEEFTRLVHPDDAERVRAAIRRTLEHDAPYEIELRVVHPGSGEVRWLSTTGRVFRDGSGNPVRMTGATTDVTARKDAERQRDQLLDSERAARADAERASRVKDEFLATVSHELRTPLNAILGYAQLLRFGSGDPTEVREGLEVIERNARVQTQIIEDLLDMSRIISGKLRVNVQTVDLAGVVRAAVETVKPAADAKGIRLHVVLDPSADPVSGDASRLQQVVWNLVSNAIKFTPKGGKVQVVLRPVNSHVEVAVADTGQGIRPEFLPSVFERFRQADASTTRKHGGLGLGLSIVKSLVELHGGSVRAHSPGEGCGATFVVSLPLSVVNRHGADGGEGGQHPKAPTTGPRYDRPSLDGVRVLVVDDEPDALELVRRLLEDCGAEVARASSAEEAIARLDDGGGTDVIVSDIGMPDVDGYEFIRRVRQRGPRRHGGVPAAALTAFARSEDRTRALAAGFQTHIAKPVEPAELVFAVASLAGRTGTEAG